MKRIHEALYLLGIASTGFLLNALLLACILLRSRKLSSAFILHACALDLAKCAYCVPFATSLLRDAPPPFCAMLGAAYVLVITASAFNLLAMVCCEAYVFSVQQTGSVASGGSMRCIMFGVAMVYLASIIIHLGPTVIGGDFAYNEPVGNCTFTYGSLKSYVVRVMWIVVVTLAVGGALYYLYVLQRHVRAHSTHRLATLVRASIAVAQGTRTDTHGVRRAVHAALCRARALLVLVILFVLCWYPLFALTLADPLFRRPKKLYRLLTFVACSNAAINPLVFLLFDRNITVCQNAERCRRCLTRCQHYLSVCRQHLGWAAAEDDDPDIAGHYQQVGCRLCQQGEQHHSTHCNGGALRKQTCDV